MAEDDPFDRVVLAPGEPRAEAQGEQIGVTIPSGKDVIEIALSLHQALNLLGDTRLAIEAVFADLKQRANAEVIPLKRKQTRKRRA
jgi:hypothetical protein